MNEMNREMRRMSEREERLAKKADRNIGKYILKRICSEKLILQIAKVKVFNPNDYRSVEELHTDLCLFYLDS